MHFFGEIRMFSVLSKHLLEPIYFNIFNVLEQHHRTYLGYCQSDALAADNADVLAADAADVLAADKCVASKSLCT